MTALLHRSRARPGINGDTIVFGNASRLYKNAMTWWDHKTKSIWSQLVGQAIEGSLTGMQLELLPLQLTTWGNWKSTCPNTLVMVNELEHYRIRHQEFQDDFVIGLALDDHVKAYYFATVEKVGIINDSLGSFPVLVWADRTDYRAYLRVVGSDVLTFNLDGQYLIDDETQSIWDVRLGTATDGLLQGKTLQPVPSLTSFDWAWENFYSDSGFFSSD